MLEKLKGKAKYYSGSTTKTLRTTNYRYTSIMCIFTYIQAFKMAKVVVRFPSERERQATRNAKCLLYQSNP